MSSDREGSGIVFGATLSRRTFVVTGGALVVGAAIVGPRLMRKGAAKGAAGGASGKNSLDPSLASSWIEIHADNTILIRTGKNDFGQGTTFTAYPQIVADELRVPFEAITTVVQGDTHQTPDGSGAFDFLGGGTPNIRKAAAYTYQALLAVAATKLGVSKDALSVTGGVVTGGGKSVTYGELVKDQQLALTIPVSGDLHGIMGLRVEGDPPMRPASEYTVIGKSFANPVIREKVSAKKTWVTDVRLPGMLHARVVHPATLGSTLVAAGEVDTAKFPNAQVIVKGNLLGVVAPTEWEAIQAANQVAQATKWSEWSGLPAHDALHQHLREKADWKTTAVANGGSNTGDVASATSSAIKRLSASYEMPYMKHAPIGPTIAVADVKDDGSVHLYVHNQNPQQLRGEIAMMLGTSPDHVIVHAYPGAGHYGRSNGGNSGAEDEAVILSKAVGKPVRVQWMRADDMQWSTQSPAAFSDVEIALDASGRMSAYRIDHHMPAMQDDRPVGAVLAGMPTMPAPSAKGEFIGSTVNNLSDPWLYAGVPNVSEQGHGTMQLGQEVSPIAVGLRDHSMRTPGQYQQNFPRELAITEAAALAGKDPLQFRIDHASEPRVKGVLEAVRDASGWETRPSTERTSARGGSAPLRGRGVSLMFRSGTYWACVCEVAVVPDTGTVTVERCTVAVDPGIVINPQQLKRQVEGGAVMGISHALYEELPFDEKGVTATSWANYRIATMADVPPIKVVLINNPEVGSYGGGSEAANALAASAIASAVHDATGKVVRRLPLKPEYVKGALQV